MTVNEIDCKTNLTIGGQKPLDASALQKIQDQIIAPSQTIYVSNHGDDNNDGSDWTKAIRTLDKATELVRNNVPTVSIVLDNTDDDVEYPLTGDNLFASKNNSAIYFSIKNYWDAMNNVKKRPIIKPTKTIRFSGTQYQYYIGYSITDSIPTVGLTGIRVKYPNNAVIKAGYSPQLFIRVQTLSLNPGTNISLIENAVLEAPVPSEANTLSGDSYSIEGTSSSYLAKTNLTIVTSSNPTDETTWKTWIGEEIGVFLFITKSRATITGINPNKVAADCKVLYTNI